MTEQAEFFETFIKKNSPLLRRSSTSPRAKRMSSFEEPSLAESNHVSSLDSTLEPSPEPWTPKEGVIRHSKFIIKT